MPKILTIIAMLVILAPKIVPLRRQSVKPQSHDHNDVQNKSNDNQNPTPPTSLAASVKQSIAADAHIDNAASENENNKVDIGSVPELTIARDRKGASAWFYDWSPAIFSGLLVLVGGFQIELLRRTWITIARQVDIQESGMQQWIEVGNWMIDLETTARGKELRITVEIANPTIFPLTISNVQISMASRQERGTCTWVRGDYYLIPKSPLMATFHFQITDIEYEELLQNGRMHFDVKGSLFYIDVLKNRKSLAIRGVLTCASKGTHFTPEAGAMDPKNEG